MTGSEIQNMTTLRPVVPKSWMMQHRNTSLINMNMIGLTEHRSMEWGFNFAISFLVETLFWPLIFINLCLLCVAAWAYKWSACYCGSVLTKTGSFHHIP